MGNYETATLTIVPATLLLGFAATLVHCGPGDSCEVYRTCPTSAAGTGGSSAGGATSTGGAGPASGPGGASAGGGGSAPDTCGNGVFEPGELCFPARGTDHAVGGISPIAMRIFDCDGDSAPDILTVNALSGNLSAVPLNNGQLGRPVTASLSLGSPISFDVGEIYPIAGRRIVVGSATGVAQVFTFDDNCALQSGNNLSLGEAPLGGVLVVDKDDNGIDDLVAITDSELIYSSNGNTATTYATANPAVQARRGTVARLDANSRDDIAFLSPVDNKVWWAFDAGGLYWTITTDNFLGTGSNPSDVVAADFDGDNVDDLAISNKNANTVTVLLNDGAGFLTKRQGDVSTTTFFANATAPNAIAAGDIDGDGDIDLAVAHESHVNDESLVVILVNDGAGSFSAVPVSTLVYRQAHDLQLFDIDADGALDIIALSSHDDGANGGQLTAVLADP